MKATSGLHQGAHDLLLGPAERRTAPSRAPPRAESSPEHTATAAETGEQRTVGRRLAVSHRLAVPVRQGLREDAAEDAGDTDEDEGAEVYSLV